MLHLIAGLVIFLGIHSVAMVRPTWRSAAIARIGEPMWKVGYSLLAVVGLWLIVEGDGDARETVNPVVLYHPPTWLRHLTLLLMVPVFPLLFAAYLPGRIQYKTRHPMLVAVKLWAVAHLLANGSLADVFLFGALLVWAVADRISLKRRPPDSTSVPAAPPGRWNDLIAVIGGLGTYIIFLFWAHQWLFGQAPLGG